MGHTILSVESDAAVRRGRSAALREAGFEVIETESGPDALRLVSEKQPAVVIAAVELPGLDGLEVAKRLKADPRTSSIPVLHISSRGNGDYPESLRSGAEAYLQSPVEEPLLIAVVTALIQRARRPSAQDRFSALIDSMPDEVWFADAQGRFTLANAPALREFQIGAPTRVDVEELARSLEVYRPDGSPRPVEEGAALRALKGETVRSQEEIVRTPVHGELRYRQVSASPVRDAAGNIVASVSVVRDITERRRAEQAQRASEERYRTLFETMTEGFALDEIVCDEAGKPCDLRYLAVNPAFERQTGLKAEDILGRTVMDLFPATEPVWIERYGKVALTGEPARFEAWFGPLARCFEVSAFQTEPGRFGVVFTDITARKRAEEERQRLAGDLAAILDAAPVAIWIAHDPQCLRITGNAHADQVVMQTERGGNISASAPPGDEAVSYRVFRKGVELRPEELPNQIAAATGQPVKEDEYELVFPGGRVVHLLLGAVPLFDAEGRVRGSVTAGVDLTRRQRAEEALRQEKAALEAASLFPEQDPAPVLRVGGNGALLYANPNSSALLAEWKCRVGQTVPADLRQAVEEALAQGAPAEFDVRTGGRDYSFLVAPIPASRYANLFGRDVTVRRRLTERLREQMEELETVMEVAPVAIWVAHDPQCQEITGNRMAGRFYEAGEGENVSANVSTARRFFRGGRELEPRELPMQEAAARGVDIRNSELDVLLPSGRLMNMLGNASPLRDAAGQVRGCVGTFLDITDYKRAEEALRESEAALRSFFDSPGMMRGFVDLIEGSIVHVSCNQAAAAMFGIDRESIAGKSAAEAGATEEVARLWVDLYEKSRRTGQPVSTEYARRGADGRERWLLATASYVGTGHSGHPRFAYTILDLSDRKRAEEALRESEERFRTMADGCPMIILVTGADGGNRFVNRTYREFFGVTSEQVEGGKWQPLLHPDDAAEYVAALRGAIRERMPFRAEARVRRADGEWRWIAAYAEPRFSPGGEFLGHIGVCSDIGERKRAEEALRERESQLRTLSDNLPEGAIYRYRLDVNGELYVDFISAGIERLTGVPAIEYMRDAATLERNIVPEDRDRLHAAIASSRQRLERFDIEVRHRHRATGEIRWSLLRSTPLRCPEGSTIWDGIELDITERKRAEEALRESEKKYRAIGESIDYGVWVCAPDGRNIYASESFLKLVGLTQEQCSSFGWGEVLHPDDAERTIAAWRECVRTEGIWDIEHRFRGVDGEWHPILARGVPVRDERGRIACWAGINLDIGARKRAEEEVRQSEERYRTLFDTMLEGFCIIEVIFENDVPVDYRFLEINPAFEGQTGLKNARGRLMRDLAPDHEAHWFQIYGHVALTGQPARFVNEAKALNRYYDVSAYRIGGPESRKVAILFNDIAEAKRTEEALRASESRERARAAELEALMDAAPAAIFIAHDAECRSMTGNRTAHALLRREFGKNLSKSAPEGEKPTNFRAMKDGVEIPPENLPLQKAASSGQPVRGYELDIVFEDGACLNLLGDAVPLLDENGVSRGAVGILSDITEFKRAEQRLRDAQKLESLGLLAGGVAHDFNNLLVGVIGNASLAQDMLPPDHPVAELLTGVLKTGEQAAHLTRQMLAYSGKGKFLVEALDLSALIPDMSGLVRPSIPKKVVLYLDLEKDLPPIQADRGQVQQVFMNLVLNAAEAIGSHEGLIAVKTGVENVTAGYARQHPEAAGIQPGKYVYLEVSDNGCGMDEATKARIFDPFFTTKFTGRGLGLAAVAGIVRGHKGAIAVGSAPGKGSCFTVLFPAAARAVEEPKSAVPEPALQGAGVVLVVDDEQVVLQMAKRALERQGYTVLLSDSGRAAIDLLRRHPGEIGLVILDLSMPNMNGEEALPEIRKLRPGVKVVVSSGYSESETMVLFKGQRVSGFIQKPYTAAALAEKVKVCLG
jgi:PAS domain S-box-containing protein